MCKYSLKENLIFFHIPKCGGTSYINNNDIWETIHELSHSHYTYQKAKNYFGSRNMMKFWENCDMYARVREPIARMKSLFSYVVSIPSHSLNIDTKKGFEPFVHRITSSKSRKNAFGPCYEFLMNYEKTIDPRIKIERLEDIKTEKIHNTTESHRVEVTKTAENMIREFFKKDYETWY